jgi:hypothetical protein
VGTVGSGNGMTTTVSNMSLDFTFCGLLHWLAYGLALINHVRALYMFVFLYLIGPIFTYFKIASLLLFTTALVCFTDNFLKDDLHVCTISFDYTSTTSQF